MLMTCDVRPKTRNMAKVPPDTGYRADLPIPLIDDPTMTLMGNFTKYE